MRRFLDALAGTKDPCFLGEQLCRHSVLLDPASSARPSRAPRPDPPVVCPGFGLDASCIYRFVCFTSPRLFLRRLGV